MIWHLDDKVTNISNILEKGPDKHDEEAKIIEETHIVLEAEIGEI